MIISLQQQSRRVAPTLDLYAYTLCNKNCWCPLNVFRGGRKSSGQTECIFHTCKKGIHSCLRHHFGQDITVSMADRMTDTGKTAVFCALCISI